MVRKSELECLLLIFTKSNSQFIVIYQNKDFENQYIRTHAKEKPFHISNITLVILPFYQKKNIAIKLLSWVFQWRNSYGLRVGKPVGTQAEGHPKGALSL